MKSEKAGRQSAALACPLTGRTLPGKASSHLRRRRGMALHLEFVVLGPPISNQQSTPSGRANLATWRKRVVGEATLRWPYPPLTVDLKAVIINFYDGQYPSVDVDNMSKPILDVMQTIVYGNDRQVVQAEISHVPIMAPFTIGGIRDILVTTIHNGVQFVYVRIEDPIFPFPLPR